VYVVSAGPNAAAPNSRVRERRVQPSSSAAVEAPIMVPNEARIHEPTLIGEVILKTRSMFAKRAGRPRSAIRSTGAASAPASAARFSTLARRSAPRIRAHTHSMAAAPAIPPIQK
jgi:hypothetical protein